MNQQPDKKPELTSRQIEILKLCADYPELSTQEIAEKLGLANSSVRNLLSSSYIRLGVTSRVAAIAEARKLGLISQPLILDG